MSRSAWSVREDKDREGTLRRRQLLDAARTVFERVGYGPATISDITKAAGVSRPTFYVYFASKEQVFSVIADEVRDAYRDAQSFHDVDPDDLEAVLATTADSTLGLAIENSALLSSLDHQALSDPGIRDICTSIREESIQRTTRYLEAQAAKGALDLTAEPRALAVMGFSMNEYYAAQVVFGNTDRATAFSHIVQVWAAAINCPRLARIRPVTAGRLSGR
ncbi:TetR/AcrR family transcriptional regulator [Streptomyces sp. NPDC004549]|uniref:TetR/AcrR family transcriptional regulator n=1 Tax=Streptomyces sp. NPDC004549 TaxID=3154283 RepID=UPI0033A1EEFC